MSSVNSTGALSPSRQMTPTTSVAGFPKHKYLFELKVEQQPVRARMCGFGDKDRRPITPPPCIRLVVRHPDTKEEVCYDDIDSTFLILNVDLWDQEGQLELNLVRHQSAGPNIPISTAALTPFPPPHEERPAYYTLQYNAHGNGVPNFSHPLPQPPQLYQMVPSPGAQGAYQQMPPQPPGPGMPGQGFTYGTVVQPWQQQQQPHPHQHHHTQPQQHGQPPQQAAQQQVPPQGVPHPNAPSGMFTRNLIGSLSVNAFKLKDTEGNLGLWFVLQDLSVRTEGHFRLRMNFIDIGDAENPHECTTGKAPILASCYSKPFQVFSAKKFPGVIESTDLSKVFATQGIKIPIRKDGPKNSNADDSDDNDDD